ncbi:MAG: BCCT family transporter [Xanthomonadales bacterium]|nr:BCCT family transporter [Xanthomonadales bacterium]
MVKNWTYVNSKGNKVLDLNPWVFLSSLVIIVLFVGVSLLNTDGVTNAANSVQQWITNTTGWFFVLTVNIILIYVIYLLFSRYGTIRLGGRHAKPEFGAFAWLSMLFSAGMGIGLMFYSIGEPIFHLITPPRGAEPGSLAAYQDAIKTTYLHWGLHAWAIYALAGLALAYFSFNRQQPLSIRSLFYPILGDRVHGAWGHLIDTLATVATLFGVATSLGFGVTQINSGLNHLFGIPIQAAVQLGLTILITLFATFSVVLGLEKGIKRLSEINVGLALALLIFVLLVGPTIFILNAYVENIGLYLDDFFALGFWNETYTDGDWQNSWTVFYWAWWITWAPFVGIFIARISRGRTIRAFIGGVLIVASLMTFFWFSVFGGSAFYMEMMNIGTVSAAVQENLSSAMFVFLEQVPAVSGLSFPYAIQVIVSLFATLVIVFFFVTSSDSGSLVIDIITAGGRTDPPVVQRVFWAGMEGIVASILLLGGGLSALQTATISSGLPFAVIMLVMIFSLQRALDEDYDKSPTLIPSERPDLLPKIE